MRRAYRCRPAEREEEPAWLPESTERGARERAPAEPVRATARVPEPGAPAQEAYGPPASMRRPRALFPRQAWQVGSHSPPLSPWRPAAFPEDRRVRVTAFPV